MATKKNNKNIYLPVICDTNGEWLPRPCGDVVKNAKNIDKFHEEYRKVRDSILREIVDNKDILTFRDIPNIKSTALIAFKLNECPEIKEILEERKSKACNSMLKRWVEDPKTPAALQKTAFYILADEHQRKLMRESSSSEESFNKIQHNTVNNTQINLDPTKMNEMMEQLKNINTPKQIKVMPKRHEEIEIYGD